MQIIVVESPAKAKTIGAYLGVDYKVLASYGHIRDLPQRRGSVRPDDNFAIDWEMDATSAERIKEIAAALRDADRLILATDPDREGEAISWHVLEALKGMSATDGKDVSRVTFNAITKEAVVKAMAAPREIDMKMVDAYLARRALDYLVGFTLSPILWRKLPGARSAGRVQSVALRLIVNREAEIEQFEPEEYWSVTAALAALHGGSFQARLSCFDGTKVKELDAFNEATARSACDAVKNGQFRVESVEAKPTRRNPDPPFTTSTMQQEAARKLGFSAARTMQVAQHLYTAGHITYMRTDNVSLDPGALTELRNAITGQFGENYVPAKPHRYTSNSNAQEAHEAIRPTDPSNTPESLLLDRDLGRLYELIWKRTLASQMAAAALEKTTVELSEPTGRVELRATGEVILFDGFLKLYKEGDDEEEEKQTEKEHRRLPQLQQGETVTVEAAMANQHFTKPPARFSEASLVKKLEELGIGRPSTYASILGTLRERNYVTIQRKRFIPDDRGRIVIAFLETYFQRYVEYGFTANLEQKLDQISSGDLPWKQLMREFWSDFHTAANAIANLRVGDVVDKLNEVLGPRIFPQREDGGAPRSCQVCGVGQLSIRLGRNGAFVGCSHYPECQFTRPLRPSAEAIAAIHTDGVVLGEGKTGRVTLKTGRFGPFIEMSNGADRPSRVGVPPGWSTEDLTLEKALKLLSLPCEVGLHPGVNEVIFVSIGRYGPYLQMGETFASLPKGEDPFGVNIQRAVALIDEKRASVLGAATAPARRS
jgi:DNA topoisomerase-1